MGRQTLGPVTRELLKVADDGVAGTELCQPSLGAAFVKGLT
jgi:hypothetical protein